MLIYAPAFPILFSSMDRKVGHLRRYRRKEPSELLEKVEIRVNADSYVDSLGFAATLVF